MAKQDEENLQKKLVSFVILCIYSTECSFVVNMKMPIVGRLTYILRILPHKILFFILLAVVA